MAFLLAMWALWLLAKGRLAAYFALAWKTFEGGTGATATAAP